MIRTLALAFLLFSTCAYAQDASKWDALVAAAKKEGKVVVIGPPDAQVRPMARYMVGVQRSCDLAG